MRAVVHKRKEKAAAAEAAKAAQAAAAVVTPAPIVLEEPLPEVQTARSEGVQIEPAPVAVMETSEDEPTALLATIDDVTSVEVTMGTATVVGMTEQQDVPENQPTVEARNVRRPRWQRFYRQQQQRAASGERKPKQASLKQRRLVMQQAIAQRMLQLRALHMLQLPSLHDNYWRCMKAFHFGSQMILPLAFGAFAVFYFFIYPSVRTNQGECI